MRDCLIVTDAFREAENVKTPQDIVLDVIDRIWSEGDVTAVEQLIAPAYTIHHDPGDAWEGRTFGHEVFLERLKASRGPFPDQRFTVHDNLAEGTRVATRWTIEATHLGDLVQLGLPATGQRVQITGMTIYEVIDGLACGHWQQVDRAGLLQQLGGGPR